MKAKNEEKERATQLRMIGWSYKEIVEELEVSKSSVSIWVAGVQSPQKRQRFCRKCGGEFSPTVVIDGRRVGLTSRKYCLTGSPFGGRNRRKLHLGPPPSKLPSPCEVCSKICSGRYTCTSRIRRFRVKSAAIKLLGGKCSRCSWTGHTAGFEFHHLRDKEFTIALNTNRSWAIVKKELLKCELLCACCHRIQHSGDRSEKFLAAVNDYKGGFLDF